MLEQQDFIALESMMRRVVLENNAEMKEYIAGEFERNNAGMKEYIAGEFERNNAILRKERKEDIHESECFLLDEMERYYQMTKNDIDKLSKRVDAIESHCRIHRSEDDMCGTLFRLYHQQQKEIDDIKQKIAFAM